MKTTAIASVLAVAVAFAGAANAGTSTKFSNRARVEKLAAQQFLLLEKRAKRPIYTVAGIGCAKTAIGHALCAISATGPHGRQLFMFRLACKDDAGHGCVVDATPMKRFVDTVAFAGTNARTKFTDSASFEKLATRLFITLERDKLNISYTVTGIGCAKTSIVNGWCAVSATGPHGRQAFMFLYAGGEAVATPMKR
jgi:hypothetical protein